MYKCMYVCLYSIVCIYVLQVISCRVMKAAITQLSSVRTYVHTYVLTHDVTMVYCQSHYTSAHTIYKVGQRINGNQDYSAMMLCVC